MSFKREEIRGILGEAYTDDIAKALINLHRTVVDPLKDQLDDANKDATRYKAEADKVPGLAQKVKDLEGGEDWKSKYEKAQKDLDDYKAGIAREQEVAELKAAHRKMLIEEGISEKAVDSILNATDYSKAKLKDGALDADSAESLKKDINERWAGFKTTTRQRGEKVDNPPKPGNGQMTREEIMKIKDTTERQKAIQANLELFQKG